MKYYYEVRQVRSTVELSVYRRYVLADIRKAELIITTKMEWHKLGFLTCLKCDLGTPEAIDKQFEEGHKQGQAFVDVLEKQETV
jgi:hypothetical protein